MTRSTGASRYDPLVDFLRAQPPHDVTLPLIQVEALVSRRLPDTAWVNSGWWRNRAYLAVRAWEALGWRAYLDVRQHAVTFRRTDADPPASGYPGEG
jgi:hypothetical protein